ncbi:MAG: metallophosphoesterase [Bacteriovorax sp.]|nr:metallophosphoesterase [Bacteriovorax sp.]
MGYKFKLEDANIVAFVTTPNVHRGYKLPFITKEQLYSFLHSINSNNIISSNNSWKEHLIETAQYAIKTLNYFENRTYKSYRLLYDKIITIKNIESIDMEKIEHDEIKAIEKELHENDKYITTKKLKQILEPIQNILSDFDLFGVVIYGNNESSNHVLEKLATHYAEKLLEDTLILIAENENYGNNSFIEVLSAAKPFSVLSNNDSEGILFWDKKNNSAFLPFNDLMRFENSNKFKLNSYIDMHLKKKSLEYTIEPTVLPTILHLSDLHFGNKDVSTNLNYLISHLGTLKGIKHIVITGDLIENPETTYCHLYNYFIGKLQEVLNVPITIVAGNHDHRSDGWLGARTFRNCDLNFDENVIIDDNIQTIFFCIDSNIDGKRLTESYLARGHVSNKQLVEIGKAYQEIIRTRDHKISNYNKIALIHHHPFPFTYDTKNFIKKARFYIHDKTLMLDNADEIITWCNDMKINLILHGHKHLQRYVKCEVNSKLGTSTIDALGCGTSTGTKGNLLSYNLIAINNTSKKYNYSFFSGKNNASGFYPEYLKIHRETR